MGNWRVKKLSRNRLIFILILCFAALIVAQVISTSNITFAEEPEVVDNSTLPSLARTEGNAGFTTLRINRTFNHYGSGKDETDGDYSSYDKSKSSGGVVNKPWSNSKDPDQSRSNSGNTDWGMYNGKVIKSPVSALTYQYAQNELELTAAALKRTGSETDLNNYQPVSKKDGKRFIHIQTQKNAWESQGYKRKDPSVTGSDNAFYVMIDNSKMPKTEIKEGDASRIHYIFSSNGEDPSDPSVVVLDKKDSTAPEKGIGQLIFTNVGKIQGQDIDARFTIDRVRVSQEAETSSGSPYGNEYAKGHDQSYDQSIEFQFISISNTRLSSLVHRKVEEHKAGLIGQNGYDCIDLQSSSGSLGLTTDTSFWNSADASVAVKQDVRLKVEIDYTIGIYYKDAQACDFPIYTFYTDLDVQNGAAPYKESISPIVAEKNASGKRVEKTNKLLNYMMAFEPEMFGENKDQSRYYVSAYTTDKYERASDGVEVSATIKADRHCGVGDGESRSTYYPDTFRNTGCIVLTDPRQKGEYSARWRGSGCGTSVTMSPYTMFLAEKSIEGKNIKKNIADPATPTENDKYKFNIDFPMGKFNETIFGAYNGVALKDYLPAGLSPCYTGSGASKALDCSMVLLKEDGTLDKSLTLGTDYTIKESVTDLGHCITATTSDDFIHKTSNYNGGKLRLIVNAYCSSYDGGTIVSYPKDEAGYDITYKDQSAVQFTNKCFLVIDDLGEVSEIEGNPVHAYTPLYTKNHDFYVYDAKKSGDERFTDASVPQYVKEAALPDPTKYQLKNGESCTHSDIKDASYTVRGEYQPEGYDKPVEGIWLFKQWENQETKVCHNADVLFKGYWVFVPNPEQKEGEFEPGQPDQSRIPVQIGSDIKYKLVGTYEIYDPKVQTGYIDFIDIPSKGLTFKPNTAEGVKITAKRVDLDGKETTIDTTNPEEFTWDATQLEPDYRGDGKKQILFRAKNIPYGSKVEIHTEYVVNEQAKDSVSNTLTVNNITKAYSNPVGKKDYDISRTDASIHDDSPVRPGQTIAFYIDWAGYESFDSSVVVKDTPSAGLSLVEDSIQFIGPQAEFKKEGDNTYVWDFENVAAGTKGTISYLCRVDDDAEWNKIVNNHYELLVDNSPMVDVTFGDNPVVPDPIKEYDSKSDKVNDDRPVVPGDEISYKITWSNYHNADASVTIYDKLHENLEYVPGSCSLKKESGEAFDPSISEDNTLTWDLGTKQKGDCGTFTYRAKVKAEAAAVMPGDVSNSYKYLLGNDPVREINSLVNPVIAKKYDPARTEAQISDDSPIKPGQQVAYKISWAGKTYVDSSVKIVDMLSNGLYLDESSEIVFESPAGVEKPQTEYNSMTGQITWNFGTVPAGAKGSISYIARVGANPPYRENANNTYTLNVDNKYDIVTEGLNNPLIPWPVKEYNSDASAVNDDRPVIVGEEIAYKITWSNHHNGPATVNIKDTLGEGLEYVEGSCDGEVEPTVDGNILTWELGEKPKADFNSFTYRVKVTEAAAKVLPNTVNNSYNLKIGNDQDIDINALYNPVVGKEYNINDPSDASDASLRIVSDDSPLRVGDIVAYKISWANNYDVFGNVKLTDTLSKGLEYVSGSSSTGEDPVIENNVLTWDLGKQDPRQSGFVTYRVRVTKDALSGKVETTSVQNSYTLTVAPEDRPEYTVGPSTITNQVVPDPVKRYDTNAKDCAIDAGSIVRIGDMLAYSLVWSHTVNGEADVRLTDTLSKGLSYVEGSANVAPTSVTAQADGTTKVVWELKKQPKASCGEITYKAKVNKDVNFEKGVDNSYSIKVGNDKEQFVNGLHNDAMEVVIATGDSSWPFMLFVCLAIVSAFVLIIERKLGKRV